MIQTKLKEILPDEMLFNLVKDLLNESNYVLPWDEPLKIPKDVELHVVYRMLNEGNQASYFCPLAVSISIGAYTLDSIKGLVAKYCFVVLHFDDEINLITSDWDSVFY